MYINDDIKSLATWVYWAWVKPDGRACTRSVDSAIYFIELKLGWINEMQQLPTPVFLFGTVLDVYFAGFNFNPFSKS
jgi:hypothetical protein